MKFTSLFLLVLLSLSLAAIFLRNPEAHATGYPETLLYSVPTTTDEFYYMTAVQPSSDANVSAVGAPFNFTTHWYLLSTVSFCMNKDPGAGAVLVARLYETVEFTDVWSSPAWKPTGTYLAQSGTVSTSSLPDGTSGTGTTWINFTFTGANMYNMAPNTIYCIDVEVLSATHLGDGPMSDQPNTYTPGIRLNQYWPTNFLGRFQYYLSDWQGQHVYPTSVQVYGVVSAPVGYHLTGLLDEDSGILEGPVSVTALYNDTSGCANITEIIYGYNVLWNHYPGYVPICFLYNLTATLARFIYLAPNELMANLTLYNATNLRSVTINIVGDVSPYDFIAIGKASQTLEKLPLIGHNATFFVEPGGTYSVTLSDGTNATFPNVPMLTDPTTLYIGGSHGGLSANTLYIPPFYILIGRVGDILAALGVAALLFSHVHDLKSGLQAFVIMFLVAIVFFVIWFIMSALEAYT